MPGHLLSVVMPTHNRSALLERAARSVLDQEPGQLELIIVDDASSDDTPAMTDRLADDRRVVVVRNDAALGPGGARNAGIAVARGDLLGFCDDDDAWLPGAAAAVIQRFDTDAEVGVVTGWHRVVHDRTGHTALFRGPLSYGAEQLLWFNAVALPFGVIRRAMFPDDLAVDPTLPPCEDWDLWLRCAQLRPICTVPHPSYAYHQHGGDRVTRAGTDDLVGRRRFCAKHDAAMSPRCRIYHQLVEAQVEGGPSAVRKRMVDHRWSPLDTAAAASVLALGATGGSIGTRRHDPGLSFRLMASLVGRLSPRGPGTGDP